MEDKIINRKLKYEYPKFIRELINDLKVGEYKNDPIMTFYDYAEDTTFKDFIIFDFQLIQNDYKKSNDKDDSILILNFWDTYFETITWRILRDPNINEKHSTSTFKEIVKFFKCLKVLCLKHVEKVEKYIVEDSCKSLLIEVKDILEEDLSSFNNYSELYIHFGSIEKSLQAFVKETGHEKLTSSF